MHFIIGGGFVSSLSSLRQPDFSPSLFCLRKPQGVYFTETRCVAISDRESQAHKKISIINTPQAILLLMFILHTLLGAGRRWPNPLCVGSGVRTWESPHYYYHYYCLKISPLSHFILSRTKFSQKSSLEKRK